MKNILVLLTLVFFSCREKYANPHVMIETEKGDIEVEVYPGRAPATATRFLSYVDSGYYANSSFYRVLKADELPNPNNTGLIQGGIWESNPQLKVKLPGITHESTRQSGLTHQTGTISMARLEPGTASSEFFICIGDQSMLDADRKGTEDGLGFAAFGKVVKGMPIVRKIQEERSHGDKFDNSIRIKTIRRL